MHQLRVHLSHIGLPIVGDKLYGATTKCPPHTIALVSVGISLPLPKGSRLDLDVRNLFDVDNYL
jgi:23S rRNA-/tRNA-specific pseudouridylate synthase